jgi:hypothetical protein
VVDMWGTNKMSAKVQKKRFSEFTRGKTELLVMKYNFDTESHSFRDFTLKLANENYGVGLYHIVNNNCKYFARDH